MPLSAVGVGSWALQAADVHIGLFSQWYEPEPTQVPSVLARELRMRDHLVRVLTGFPNYPEGRLYDGYQLRWRHDEVVAGVPVRRVALFPSHGSSAVGRIANYGSFAISAAVSGVRWFKDVEAVWVCNSPPTVGLPTWLLKSRYRPRVVLHVLDLWPESLQASGFGSKFQRRPWLRRGLDAWLSMTYRVADSIACTTHMQIELLQQRGVPRSKLAYVPTWVDETIFSPLRRDAALATTLGVQGKRVLLYAGTLGEAQGLDTLVDACAEMRDDPSFHCLIAGTGVAEPRLRSKADQLRLDNVSFLGRWPIRDMTRLMSVGDIHFISLRSDRLAESAMPSKLPATLACAKPLIVAARGDASQVVRAARAGWVCSPGDAAQLEAAIRSGMAADEPSLRSMGRNGRRVYEDEFSVKVGVNRLERLLGQGSIRGQDAA